jgi:NTP pyrophosphatase (non-canonical NTP hydrolase)
MNFKEYQQLALRTCKVMDANIYNAIHMVMGITSEYFEFKEAEFAASQQISVNEQIERTLDLKKELGDVLWYVAGLAHFMDLKFDEPNFDDGKPPMSIEKAIETFNSVFKANWIYDRAMIAPDKTGVALIDQVQNAIDAVLYWVCVDYGFFNTEEIMTINIEKLAKRYPEKFEEHLANNRKKEDN